MKKKTAKKTPKKKAAQPAKSIVREKGKLIGTVTHYFANIDVGVIKLSAPLAKGDVIRIVGGQSTDFNQTVSSMQVDHEEITKAKKGNSIGLKVKEKVREGYRVYKA